MNFYFPFLFLSTFVLQYILINNFYYKFIIIDSFFKHLKFTVYQD